MMITTNGVDRNFFSSRALGRIVFATILVVGAFVSFSPVSQAAPPSVVDQYTEQPPSPGGEGTTQGNTGTDQSDSGATTVGSTTGGSGGGGSPQSGSQQTSGTADGSGTQSGNGGSAGAANQGAAANSRANDPNPAMTSGFAKLGNEGDGGMGIFFPLVLVGILMLISALVLIRRHGRNVS